MQVELHRCKSTVKTMTKFDRNTDAQSITLQNVARYTFNRNLYALGVIVERNTKEDYINMNFCISDLKQLHGKDIRDDGSPLSKLIRKSIVGKFKRDEPIKLIKSHILKCQVEGYKNGDTKSFFITHAIFESTWNYWTLW